MYLCIKKLHWFLRNLFHKLHSEILASLHVNKNYNLVPWIGEQPYIKRLLWQFSMHCNILRMYEKMQDQYSNVSLFSNPGDKVLKRWKTTGQICPLLSTRIRTLSPRLENNNTLKCWCGIFPYILSMLQCMDNCQNSILMYGCSPIQGTRL